MVIVRLYTIIWDSIEECPESGIWQVIGNPTITAPIAVGNTMPLYSSKAVTWKLNIHEKLAVS